MAVYKRSYKTYQGPQIPSWSRFTVLTRYSLANIFSSRVFVWFVALCMLPLLVGIANIYFAHSETARSLLGLQMRALNIDNMTFARYLRIQAWFGFVVVAWAAPGMISRDFANNAMQLYLSRPLSRTEYLLGKIAALAVILSCFTWLPGLLMVGLQAQLEGHGWGWDHLYLVGSILLAGWLWIAVISLTAMALSVWVRWRIAATALIAGGVLLLWGFGGMVDGVLRTYWGQLLSLDYVMTVIWSRLFRLDMHQMRTWGVDRVPWSTALAVVVAICLMSFMLLNQRLRAREVERG